jgi:uncharacterized protein YbjT (DUF2867 family)
MVTGEKQGAVFVAGATGYVGGRLVPRLLEQGYPVRTLTRAPQKLETRPWAQHPNFYCTEGDILDRTALTHILSGCSSAYFLVNSVDNPGYARRIAAQNMASAALNTGLKQIIHLGMLSEDYIDNDTAEAQSTDSILRQAGVPVTTLHASLIIGSGSAAFEMLRYLVDRLPLIIAPRRAATPCQPIGIRNVLYYLLKCLDTPATLGQSFDIGGPQVTSYPELMRIYAEEAGLKRYAVELPFLHNRHLSAYWTHLITPISLTQARMLANMLNRPMVCREMRITEIIPQDLFDARTSIRLALQRTREQQVETRWSDSGALPPAEWSDPADPEWAGGSIFEDARRVVVKASPEQVWPSITSLGGDVGYYYANWLWKIRGVMDQLVGGVGLQRGRRKSQALYPGDAIDFWRAVKITPHRMLLLSAEMKLPGEAVLLFRLKPVDGGYTEIQQIARFLPRGILGLAYWYAVFPFHFFVFDGMLRGIAKSTRAQVIEGPKRFKPSVQE